LKACWRILEVLLQPPGRNRRPVIFSLCSIGIAAVALEELQVIAGAQGKAEASATRNLATFRPQLIAVNSFEDDRPWIDRLKLALKHRDFYAVQQSIIDLDGEGAHLVENLIYMRDDAGDQAPYQYMVIAERNDLAGLVDRLIIPGLLKSFVETSDRQIVSLSVNSILDYSFPGWLSEQMTECCVEPGKLVLQVTGYLAPISNQFSGSCSA
jgi:sensor c-di-GMP phosphodiesterase-like protein